MKYSTGPWEVSKTPPLDPTVCFSIKSVKDGSLIAEIVKTGFPNRPKDSIGNSYWLVDNHLANQTTISNAVLIASAPEMLEALEKALDVLKDTLDDALRHYNKHMETIEVVSAAIKKATGYLYP
jgi:hypothetical protein